MSFSNNFYVDRTAYLLVISNTITILLAVYEKWDLSVVLCIYWGQSLIIGYYNWRRILDLRQFSTTGFRINNQTVKPTKETQRKTATFFALHYGFFHFIYFFFLYEQSKYLTSQTYLAILLCVLIFLFNHRFSYIHNMERDQNIKPNIGSVMFFPYLRVVPMHLTILIGSNFAKGSDGALILFLCLKTAADLIMHTIEHSESRHKI